MTPRKPEQEFPAGSRWRERLAHRGQSKVSVIVYGEAGGFVSYRTARSEMPIAVTVEHFRAVFERIEHPEAPRLCPGCRALDGEHDFGPTCTLAEDK